MVRIAIEGCGHGTLHAIYSSVTEACHQNGWPDVDLLIIGGDFQSVRNAYDLNCVSMPVKYRAMGDFHEYYSGKRLAPYLTIFVGGNHEASNYLFELYYGGWVAPNIYYMGAANVLSLGPLRISGLSGIWKGYSYRKPHHERLPYSGMDMKSIYHVRELDVRKMLQIETQVDIGISHDWPKGVEWKGDWKNLFRFKRHFEADARSGQLGSVAAKQVMDWLRPRWWFSAHLHCKFAAVVEYGNQGEIEQQPLPGANGNTVVKKNEDEIDLDETLDQEEQQTTSIHSAPKNQDEIDLDLDLNGEDDSAAKPSPVVDVSAQRNADEIGLDLDDSVDEIPAAANKSLSQAVGDVDVNLSTNAASIPSAAAARAALPEAFRRPQQLKPSEEHPSAISNKKTHFLALDKCLPNRHFLQLLDIPTSASTEEVEAMRPLKLSYDREWLAITRAFIVEEPLIVGDPGGHVPRAKSHAEYAELIAQHRAWINETLSDSDLVIPENFQVTAPVYDGGDWKGPKFQKAKEFPNPQTAGYCKMLQVPNALEISEEERRQRKVAAGPKPRSFR